MVLFRAEDHIRRNPAVAARGRGDQARHYTTYGYITKCGDAVSEHATGHNAAGGRSKPFSSDNLLREKR
jgi:hypothetical protein